jgi:hypothetical protein
MKPARVPGPSGQASRSTAAFMKGLLGRLGTGRVPAGATLTLGLLPAPFLFSGLHIFTEASDVLNLT